jgi:Uma2 family endonuclease
MRSMSKIYSPLIRWYVKGMGAGTLISMGEYLDTAYSPDREYVDGAIVERHVGELPHSTVQGNLYWALRQRYPAYFAHVELRVRTRGERCRIPDVCVTLEQPTTDILESAPFLAIEVLSRRDEMSDVLEKLEEYSHAGVPHIWVIDPRRKRAFRFAGESLQEVHGQLTTESPEIRVTFEEVFQNL